MNEDNITKHESYGLIHINRATSGRGETLFGSSIKHHNIISLTISKAEDKRDLHRNWYFPHEEIIDIEMSPNQFSDLITTMNCGSGIPCTIKHINGKRMEEPVFESKRETFNKEFKQDMRDLGTNVNKLSSKAKELLNSKKPILVKEREELLGMIEMVKQEILSNIPFIQSSFNETIEKTITEAKGEIEAFITNTIIKLGTEELIKNRNAVEMLDLKSKMPEIPDNVIDVGDEND